MASYFQSLFSGSSMPKRLLQYALAQVGFVDTAALHLENLEINLGRRSVFEFRDVDLLLRKLEKSLALPEAFELVRARISLLRVTIPVNIYSSAIQVEVDGVECLVRFSAAREDRTGSDAPYAKRAEGCQRPSTDGAHVVPSLADLTQSFLEHEPRREKEKLQAAILSESRDLSASTSSDDENEHLQGTGAPLSLPAFVTSFLQGVTDRLELRIRNVSCSVEVDVPGEACSSSTFSTEDKVTVKLTVEEVDVQGVARSLRSSLSTESAVVGAGKRQIKLQRIHGDLISDAEYWRTMGHPSAPASPVATHADILDGRRSTFKSNLSTTTSDVSSSNRVSAASSTSSGRSSRYVTEPGAGSGSTDAIRAAQQGLHRVPVDQETTQFRPPGEGSFALLNDSTAAVDSDDHTTEAIASQAGSVQLPPAPRWTRKSLPIRTKDISTDRHYRQGLSPESPEDPFEDAASSQVNNRFLRSQASTYSDFERSNVRADNNQGDTDTSPSAASEMTESRLFSHEEATSMYMSALSEKTTDFDQSHQSSYADKDGIDESLVSLDTAKPSSTRQMLIEADDRTYARSHVRDPALPILDDAKLSPEVHQPTTNRKKDATLPPKRSLSAGTRSSSNLTSTPLYNTDPVIKRVFELDTATLYLPAPDLHVAGETTNAEYNSRSGHERRDSPSRDIPGAFSDRESWPSNGSRHQDHDNNKWTPSHDSAYKVIVGSSIFRSDLLISKLLIRLISTMQASLRTRPMRQTARSSSLDTSLSSFQIDIRNIMLQLVDRVGNADTTPGHTLAEVDDVVLQCSLANSRISITDGNKTNITIGNLVIGHADEAMISFDPSLQLRATTRDLQASTGVDVALSVTTEASSTRIEVTTLPLRVNVNLPRIDDILGHFGGLSGVLSLGNSMSSNITITNRSGAPKTRAVHFSTPDRPEDSLSTARNKADIRLGGLHLELRGVESSSDLNTSAIKMVYRQEAFGMSIQRMNIAGPYPINAHHGSPMAIDLDGFRLEYLPTPKDADLDRLLALITPSNSRYDQDDDILLGTLLRQRRQGSVLRVNADSLKLRVDDCSQWRALQDLFEEVSRFATVAKYLPDDERPGLLCLIEVRALAMHIDGGQQLGALDVNLTNLHVAQITLPSLLALSIASVAAHHDRFGALVSAATDVTCYDASSRNPAVMARMIGDEMEPTIRLKLWNLQLDYRVALLKMIMELQQDTTHDTSSGSNSTGGSPVRPAKDTAQHKSSLDSTHRSLHVILGLRDCILALNPDKLPSKALVVLTETQVSMTIGKANATSATVDLSKGSLLLTEDAAAATTGAEPQRRHTLSFDGGSAQVAALCSMGYVSMSYISSARAMINVVTTDDGQQVVDVELHDNLLVLESCADSTQTLIATLNGLLPPAPPSKDVKYRTKVIPVRDLLASLSGDAFGTAEGEYDFDKDFGSELASSGDLDDAIDGFDDLDMDPEAYRKEVEVLYDDLMEEARSMVLPGATDQASTDDVFENLSGEIEVNSNEPLELQEDYFAADSTKDNFSNRWNSVKNAYDTSKVAESTASPFRLRVRDVLVIWNLFDGYDWQSTRDAITKAVQDVQSKAMEKRARSDRLTTFDQDLDEDETVIGDFLFNSIYIGVSGNRDPRDLTTAINQELDDGATETESVATTSVTTSTKLGGARMPRAKRLRLQRSKHHKITFELKGICVDVVAFPPGSGETQSSIDVRIKDLEIFDHVPTSTWRKFATYMQEAGERESGSNMVHFEIVNVKPVPELAASEAVIKATVLPLRLHVDQDALDFITRFFEFKDTSKPPSAAPGEEPFLQRVEVNSIAVKLDFKPKRVDYAGLRSGHTTEFMNFVILDQADMVLRHTIIYGIRGFDRLGRCLNDIWMPDIRRNQLPGILAGLAPIRSLVNVGAGVRQLMVVPVQEYQKDGRLVRGISRGAVRFARSTGTELVKLGAKVAIGVQTVLQGAEGFLGTANVSVTSPRATGDVSDDDEQQRHISPYANQPVGVFQGLRGGYHGLQRDLVMARDAIIAVPGEVMEEGTAKGMLKAVRRYAPTIVLRPAIGVARASGQVLMGATNALDPANLSRVEAKYKKY